MEYCLSKLQCSWSILLPHGWTLVPCVLCFHESLVLSHQSRVEDNLLTHCCATVPTFVSLYVHEQCYIRAPSALSLCRKQEHEHLCAVWRAPEFQEDPIKAVSTFLTRTAPTISRTRDLQSAQKAKRKGPTAKQLQTLFGVKPDHNPPDMMQD
jgi:hypothetical protein